MIRMATFGDLCRISDIYERIHEMEQAGRYTTGWIKGVYPTRQTARDAITCGSMYVMERSGTLVAAGKIDHIQPPSYTDINWSIPAVEHEVLVLHTLVVHPDYSGQGIAKTFIRAYENMAAEKGCTCLRIDTNARNTRARSLYKRLGYTERGIIPCCFNGIEGVELVCLEKLL